MHMYAHCVRRAAVWRCGRLLLLLLLLVSSSPLSVICAAAAAAAAGSVTPLRPSSDTLCFLDTAAAATCPVSRPLCCSVGGVVRCCAASTTSCHECITQAVGYQLPRGGIFVMAVCMLFLLLFGSVVTTNVGRNCAWVYEQHMVLQRLKQQAALRRAEAAVFRRELAATEERDMDERVACVVCCARRVDNALVPCGHVCCCRYCVRRLTSCPVCRLAVSESYELPAYLVTRLLTQAAQRSDEDGRGAGDTANKDDKNNNNKDDDDDDDSSAVVSVEMHDVRAAAAVATANTPTMTTTTQTAADDDDESSDRKGSAVVAAPQPQREGADNGDDTDGVNSHVVSAVAASASVTEGDGVHVDVVLPHRRTHMASDSRNDEDDDDNEDETSSPSLTYIWRRRHHYLRVRDDVTPRRGSGNNNNNKHDESDAL